ncbi:hypothetical protein KC19_11G133300 [Ceratodon purpureus]|uniref:Uncharacterized protein n=1 Tax=Ceratodon purpureus TaxID=3225 RepID=A0A8T0GDZ5_CERPU|nr:hypothetical protein KC19_11G133300 [Ceratodon purpureus]
MVIVVMQFISFKPSRCRTEKCQTHIKHQRLGYQDTAFHDPLREVRPSSVLRVRHLPRNTVPVCKVLFQQSLARSELALQSDMTLISHGLAQSLLAKLSHKLIELKTS